MDVAAIDQLSSLLEADHQFLRKYLAENNCTDEFLPELHSSGVLDMMPELLKVTQILIKEGYMLRQIFDCYCLFRHVFTCCGSS